MKPFMPLRGRGEIGHKQLLYLRSQFQDTQTGLHRESLGKGEKKKNLGCVGREVVQRVKYLLRKHEDLGLKC